MEETMTALFYIWSAVCSAVVAWFFVEWALCRYRQTFNFRDAEGYKTDAEEN